MKKRHSLIAAVTLGTYLLLAFTMQTPTGVKGRIQPYNAALHAWAVSDKDTGNAVIQNGAFEIKGLKEGKYRIIIEGQRPYKTTTKPDVTVNNGSVTDVGIIVLDQ